MIGWFKRWRDQRADARAMTAYQDRFETAGWITGEVRRPDEESTQDYAERMLVLLKVNPS